VPPGRTREPGRGHPPGGEGSSLARQPGPRSARPALPPPPQPPPHRKKKAVRKIKWWERCTAPWRGEGNRAPGGRQQQPGAGREKAEAVTGTGAQLPAASLPPTSLPARKSAGLMRGEVNNGEVVVSNDGAEASAEVV